MAREVQFKIFRFKFSPEFTEQLETFSKIHQYDDRHTFKEAWQLWMQETPLIQDEIKTLQKMGFQGDILDKMFKSARYYYRKKPALNEKEEGPRKKYATSCKEEMKEMETHIYSYIQKRICPITNTITASPAEAYADFMKQNNKIVSGDSDDTFLELKQKKTYKNRYYIISRSFVLLSH